MPINNYLSLALLCFIAACDSESDSTDIEPNGFGKIIDSKVSGLSYKSGQYSGFTNADGEFGYITGENIQFFVGDIAIGYQVEPKEILTPYELANNNEFAALNIARFLQSIDDDANPDNGIEINTASHNLAKGKSIDFLSNQWSGASNDSEVNTLTYTLTARTSAGSRYLVTAEDAYYHFSATLDEMMSDIKSTIETEIDITGCTNNNQCKNYTLDSVWLDGCTSFGETEYLYSDVTTDLDKITTLAEQRLTLKEIKSELKSVAGVINTTAGSCWSNVTLTFPVCNAQQECELSNSF